MPPQRLAHYEILAPLGAGGMGEVYRARDTRLDREVALKILPPDLAHDPQRRSRFLTEAKAVAALNHPNIVTVYSIEEDESLVQRHPSLSPSGELLAVETMVKGEEGSAYRLIDLESERTIQETAAMSC